MKKLFLPLALIIFSAGAYSQSGQKFSTGGNTLSTGEFLGTNNLYPLIIKTNGQEWFRITETGNVGIGVIVPADKLHVAGTARMLNANIDNLMQALSVSAQSANFATALVTGQVTAGSLIVNGNATVSGLLTADNITSSTGNISFGNNNLSTSGNINSGNISSLDSSVVSQQTQITSISSQLSSIHSSQWISNPVDSSISFPGNVFVNSLNAQNSISIGAFKFSNGAIPAPIQRDTISAPNKLVIASQTQAMELAADTVTMQQLVGIGKTPTVALDVIGDIKSTGNIFSSTLTSNKITTTRITSPDSLIHFGEHSLVINTNANVIYNYEDGLNPSGPKGVGIGASAAPFGVNSLAIGEQTWAIGLNSIVIGSGISNGAALQNPTSNSLMIGFNSNLPTLVVREASGINTTGKVGIGITNPSEKLHIQNGSIYIDGESQGVIVNAGGHKRVGLMKYFGHEAGIWRVADQDFEIGRLNVTSLPGNPTSSDFTTDIYVAGNGNVGVGTKNPVRALHIFTQHIFIEPPAPCPNPNNPFCLTGSHNGLRLEDLTSLANNSQRSIWDIAPYSNGLLFSKGDPNDAEALDVKMVILDNGNVGIGEANPDCKLSIKGGFNAVCIEHDGLNPQQPYSDLVFKESANPNSRNWVIRAHTGASPFNKALEIGSITGGNILMTGPNTNDIKVGIGVTNPSNQLEVCGTIRAKEVIIEATSWCDFKLKPGYKRMTWQEKLAHIELFGYLPEMDSGSEIETSGLKVAKNLRGMIWNIEDNTMDIIDVQKENEKQKQKIENLENEIQQQNEAIAQLKKEVEQLKEKK